MNKIIFMVMCGVLTPHITQTVSFKDYYHANQATVDAELALGKLNLAKKGLTDLEGFTSEHVPYLGELRELYLQDNQLHKLPESIAQLAQLERLDVSNNQLTQIPDWICQLTKVKSLNFGDNRLSVLPKCLSSMQALDNLWVYNNPLAGSTAHQRQLIGLPQRVKLFFKTPKEEQTEKAFFTALTYDNNDAAIEQLIGKLETLKTPLRKKKDISKIRDEYGNDPFEMSLEEERIYDEAPPAAVSSTPAATD